MRRDWTPVIGQTYGRLKYLAVRSHPKYRKKFLECECDCGRQKFLDPVKVLNGKTRSCGCLGLELKTRHGFARRPYTRRPPEYRAWVQMKSRCNNPRSKDYGIYGGKGIHVCERWRDSFLNFYTDMGPRPSRRHSLDRKDSNGDYSPNNCRWATPSVQAMNRHWLEGITFRGEKKPLERWCRELGLAYSAVWRRIRRYGWSVERALETPVRKVR